MEVPEGLEGVPEGHVLLLIKALYGLKQAGCQWYQILKTIMEKFGMKQIESNPHTFIVSRVIKEEKRVLIVPVYVNDLFPLGDKVLVDEFEQYIPNLFGVSTPCDAHYFLGIHVSRNWAWTQTSPYICLDQILFIENVLKSILEFFPGTKIMEYRTVLPADPIMPHTTQSQGRSSLCLSIPVSCGQLMYIMLATHPDLAYPVGMLAHHVSNPSPDHEKALLHLAGYLKYSIDKAIIYQKPTIDQGNPGMLKTYLDTDWAGEERSGRSTTGMVVYKNNGPISWTSKRQGVISKSTMESTYIAMFNAVLYTEWLHSIEKQIGVKTYIPFVWCNNQAAIAIAKGGDMSFKKFCFMNVKYHYVCCAYSKGRLVISYVKTENNLADIFTK